MESENITLTEVNKSEEEQQHSNESGQTELGKKIMSGDLLNIDIKDENVALNLLVSFINVAHARNSFTIEETVKIWECIQFFIPKKKQNNE